MYSIRQLVNTENLPLGMFVYVTKFLLCFEGEAGGYQQVCGELDNEGGGPGHGQGQGGHAQPQDSLHHRRGEALSYN